MHPERRRRAAEIDRLARDGDWQRAYRLLVLRELPKEARQGWQVAFLRTYATPRMADLLIESGALLTGARKRAHDTYLLLYEIIHHGLDDPRSRRAISTINRAHRPWAIEPEDMTYVLCAFLVVPIRQIDTTGWRPTTDREKACAHRFVARLGELMGIGDIPADYADAERILDAYERLHVAPGESSRRLSGPLLDVLRAPYPRLLQPAVAPLFSLLLGDPRLSRALWLPVAPAPVRAAFRAALRVRGLVLRQLSPNDAATAAVFTPGMSVSGVYPDGYDLGELGPEYARNPATAAAPEVRRSGHG